MGDWEEYKIGTIRKRELNRKNIPKITNNFFIERFCFTSESKPSKRITKFEINCAKLSSENF